MIGIFILNYYYLDQRDEQRYEVSPEDLITTDVWCVACNKKINKLELHVLKTWSSGWHITEECLKDMEEWVIEELKRRETTQWIK